MTLYSKYTRTLTIQNLFFNCSQGVTLDAVVLEAEHLHDPAVVDWVSGVVQFAHVIYIVTFIQ